MRIIQRQKEDEDLERKLEQEKKQALLMHKVSVQQQMSKNDEIRKQKRQDYLEEGKKLR
jgi:hypothetical protein